MYVDSNKIAYKDVTLLELINSDYKINFDFKYVLSHDMYIIKISQNYYMLFELNLVGKLLSEKELKYILRKEKLNKIIDKT